ncbi:hypothetical protein ABT112_27045 [Streptomyces sp. NPDC002055]|uniref:hypothetical protein n=1 Tax=Streptomyces sp. NPDC002055 TaxID=3154534 RepID=UPI003322965A
MAGRERRCAHCWKPLRATARSDARFCSKACKAAERRWRRDFLEAVAIGLWYTQGVETEHVVRCPACGRRFARGHGHRRDAVYCSHACRQAAHRARHRAQRVHEDVTRDGSVYPVQAADQR